jgi:hypothetical protein
MAGKRRSGLKNDRRAYCNKPCIQNSNECPPIILSNIATYSYDSKNNIDIWTLNGSITILECQILNIPINTQFIIPINVTIINNGTINNDGTIINNEIINNNGIINNNEKIFNDGTSNNNGTINNTGIIDNTVTINNNGTINNTGTINIKNSSTFNNDGSIYNTNGLIDIILGIFNNNANINNTDGIINTYTSNNPMFISIFNNYGTLIGNNITIIEI